MRGEIHFSEIALGFESGQLRALLAGVELHQNRAFLHGCPDWKLICAIVPGRSALTITPCTASMLPITDMVDGHSPGWRRPGYRLGRRLETGSRLDCRLHLLELHETQGRQDHNGHDQHQNHSLSHGAPYCLLNPR